MNISSDAARRLARIQQELARAETPSFLPELLEQIPPMRHGTRAVICIPVAAFGEQETETLPHTLEQLEMQHGNNFEIVLFLNRPEGRHADRTLQIAKYAQERMAHLHMLVSEIPRDKVTIGYIRGLLHAVVSERARRAGINDLVHVVTDADMVWLHPHLVQAHLQRLQKTGADACIGQLGWDHPIIPTREVPALIVGDAIMRLMPKYANKRIIAEAAGGRCMSTHILEEVVFARNFGRGVLANVSIRDSAYRRVGGYHPLAHGEDYDIMQRLWEDGRRAENYGALCFGWREHDVTVTSSSRRALWALYAEGLPIVRQWDYMGYSGPGTHGALPDMGAYRTTEPNAAFLVHLVNESLVAFPLPPSLLSQAVPAVLRDIGIGARDYTLRMVPSDEDPTLRVAEITIGNPDGLLLWVRRQQETD
ncbi:MAG: hypothetical protein A3J10_00455 [Candidatus Sungbacteria bacterium RIFCSPLOWO2_02_FULL_54_10]|uniref:Glycosyltransferase 2-like domain-containing protein n=2 Tax=Candidatus Sungiibacteriota TaxID=1817917 RepID=A0A1G2L4X8_9BACT|nr:MAG: hypothetical protein A2679_02850 [Candidatus Sungbacteria bacterium RIFCSPHIGHO2_01_FULL_54_26]OHA03415.1 MAG: hypothetical protein A3C92_01180 [Candidatus Sungbacteria bacterium RIFCSPHIGHO2_02_FULL_53_17]OHA06725.1 MAG: hypothetical protein A3B34_02540 [Candidatus Sungbacteria bacterium RIFCSPLOWO2_01_FULL_54_21]OHA12244.1 MAG: hypothetical protein A3J10_00455 [Candidatus Sungbacteria bacterium RIFCSPLOWO2_02_FULL_54_10]